MLHINEYEAKLLADLIEHRIFLITSRIDSTHPQSSRDDAIELDHLTTLRDKLLTILGDTK